MKRVLFVTNGHGETAIADRISVELHAVAPAAQLDHLALVGEQSGLAMRAVGPRRAMPSGGLIAMGNVRNLLRDLRAGLAAHTWDQIRFLRAARGRYDMAVAVGDAYALAMTSLSRARTVFVGSAKSVEVAPYGRFEARLLARAAACYVRDERTAHELRRRGLSVEVANAIVDLFATTESSNAGVAVAAFAPAVALFPGSRESAYDDARFLLEIVRELTARRPSFGGVLSIARGLDADRFAQEARGAGWDVGATEHELIPFTLSRNGREVVRAWRGALGPILSRVELVLGQAGTANEAAAAAGLPIIAFERGRDREARWYRQRQRGLLGEALAVFPRSLEEAAAGVAAILDDAPRRQHMGSVGRARMGQAGGARRIAQRIAALLERS
jgi:uncharacterized protein (TIGR03492 family)